MRIISILNNDPVNSMTGFTLTLYFAGCDHYCKGCFSENTWDYNKGEEYSLEEIKTLILESKWENVTFLGGDPFYSKNRQEVIELIKFIKEETKKNIYVWTGYLKKEVDQWIDTNLIDYLIDGKFILEEKDLRLKLRGSKNQKIYKNGKNLDI